LEFDVLLVVRHPNEIFLEVFFQVFFAVLNIGRIYNGQKIKGVVKQCIDWVDTMIARKNVV
jgi:hypothetical protein